MTDTTVYHKLEQSFNVTIKLFTDYILAPLFVRLLLNYHQPTRSGGIKPEALSKLGKHSVNQASTPDLLSNLTQTPACT